MRKALFFRSAIITSLCMTACTESHTTKQVLTFPVKKNLDADWMLGEWVYEEEGSVLHEDWRRENDTVFVGESYYIENADTVFFEHLRLTLNGDSLFYESLGEKPANLDTKVFKGRLHSSGQIAVENIQQSFPRNVRYNQLNDTLMIIEVSGFIDGSEETQPYQMVRKK